MLSTLIALSSLTLAQASGGQGESVFPKQEPRNPEVLRDRSIFQFLKTTEIDSPASWPGFPEDDWSALKVAEVKPNATKLKVLLLVFERDFTNPSVCNTLEMNDKQRLIQSMSRIRSFFAATSAGELDVEVIPRFIPEPIFNEDEAIDIQTKELNRFGFDADDRVERGPYAAICTVSSSKNSICSASAFSEIEGPNPGHGLERNLITSICRSLTLSFSQRFIEILPVSPFTYPNRWPTVRRGLNLSLIDPTFRADTALVKGGIESLGERVQPTSSGLKSAVAGPITVTGADGILTYEEASIMRRGLVLLPPFAVGRLEFKVRTKSLNPIAFQMLDVPPKRADESPNSEVTIGQGADVDIKADGSWQTVRIGLSDKTMHVSFGVPSRLVGLTRNPHEIIRYEFKEFRVVTDPPTPLKPAKQWNLTSPEGISEALADGNAEIKQLALREILAEPTKYKIVQPKLLEMSTELHPAVAFGAVQAYGAVGIANDDLIGKAFMNRLVSTAPNEYAREAALLYFAKHPEQTTFEAISPNIVRRSWRTRIATVKALAALDRTDLKAKPAARQLLLTACGQDMAIIRSAALAVMKPDVEAERKQLEYSLVNDPSEQVRLQCLKILGDANAPKEVLFGALADDSPYVREQVYQQLPAGLKREALQRMVIDRDTYVRAAALRGFASLPDPTQPGEIQNTFADEHPAILLALVEGAQKGKWKLPQNVIEAAIKSKSSLVRTGAAKLGQ